MKEKYVPERKCISCRKIAAKTEFFRIVKTKDGIFADKENRLEGRGAYICKNETCISDMENKNAVARTFKMKVTPQQYKNLTEELKNI